MVPKWIIEAGRLGGGAQADCLELWIGFVFFRLI